MDAEYDRKFEEMKKYIPFLESMIKRLENSSAGSNPRQAQLDKIRSLRDLLLDKRKRMKMENLQKCEQVLVNLYAKVEQRGDDLKVNIDDLPKKEKNDLSTVRNKLKSVVSKLPAEPTDTLPEIARANETEELCEPGSKEPALFQRRPHVSSSTSSGFSSTAKENQTKRNYTRVLVSPENYVRSDTSSEKPLYSRRSPKKSPRKPSPSYYKKERKKSKNKSKHSQSKDWNITLNVPEDSLNSLNTEDILSRIINCSDNDVDIATLRDLRTQILGELKDTGANDDISDIILKSYKNKKIKKVRGTGSKKKSDVEDGEISDSESEAIESIYGNLVVIDKNKSTATENKITDKDKPRKIQICLVINSEKTKPAIQEEKNSCVDKSDFETFSQKEEKSNMALDSDKKTPTIEKNHFDNANILDDISNDSIIEENNSMILDLQKETKATEKMDTMKNEVQIEEINLLSPEIQEKEEETVIESSEKVEVIKPNFYKPLLEQDEEIKNESMKIKESRPSEECSRILPDTLNDGNNSTNDNSEVQIPLLEPTKPILEPSKEVSEIDILEALKKEILNETTNKLKTDTAAALSTPLLHQPKITKVANAKEIGPKKRISIESYKAKANTPISRPIKGSEELYIGKNTTKDENSRKQSLKLTEKECERFNFLSKLTLTESSDDEDKSSLSLDEIYSDLAPKSPDHEDFADTGLKPPVIIPSDPVQAPVVASETDVDMRKLTPDLQANNLSTTPLLSPLFVENSRVLSSENELSKSDEKAALPLVDPRVKRDARSVPNKDTPNLKSINVEKIQSPSSNISSSPVVSNESVDYTQTTNTTNIPSLLGLNIPPIPSNIPPLFPNMTPSRTPNAAPNMTPSRTPNTAPNMTPKIPLLMTPSRTPNIPNMTPNRTPTIASMTPSRHTFDHEDFSTRKHVYAPMFSDIDSRDDMDKSRENHQMQWNASDSRPSFWEDRRNCSVQRDIDYRELRRDIDYRDHSMPRDVDYRRSQSVQRDMDYRDARNSSVHSFDRREYPTTPSHPFGRMDCPPTPTPSFGRLDCPPTPNSSFGRLDCPPTPNPSFGRIDRPMTPVHPFGRSDCPSTPSHPFGRGEPLHTASTFGRSEYLHGSRSQDPRLNRTSDYDTCQYGDDDRERIYFQERKFMSGSYNTEHQSRDSFRRYRQEQSVGRYDRNRNYEPIQTHQDQISRRENSVGPSINREDRVDRGRSFNRNYEGERYSRNRSNRGKGYDYRNQNDSKNYDEGNRCGYQREKSIGRTHETSNPIEDRRPHSKFSEENKLRVNPQGGPSFTIDTSITSSFQDINVNRRYSSSFDARRQRASSVGRSLSTTNRTPTHDMRDAFNYSEKKNRNDNKYRRACSVGREVAESKLNFRDIKADLKSFKFKSNYRFSKYLEGTERRVSTESSKKFTAHNKQKTGEVYDKFNKYSPRKNNRDPRICREPSRDSKDYKNSSRDSNNYGIVYTSDNISKGTILGPGYGVKNYKIPKIKRSQEELVTIKTTDNIREEDANSSKNKTDLKEKNMEVTSQSEQKSEHNLDEQKSILLKNIRSKSTDFSNTDKKELADRDSKKLKEVFPQNENKMSESNEKHKAKNNFENRLQKKDNVSKDNERTESSDDNSYKTPEKTKEDEINILQTSSDSLDSTERRVTRSARKNMPIEPISLELSPIKRTRKAKKSLVLESDPEDNEMLSKSNYLNLDEQTLATKEDLSEQISFVESPEKRVTAKEIVNPENSILGNIKDNPVSTVLVTNNRETHLDVCFSETTQVEEQKVEPTNSNKLTNITLDEKDENTEDVLSSNFGLSDLEMFSDNIASDPVIDNINSLIADLDHDLDSSKNNDADSHFTKELNLETMLENISSIDGNEKDDVVQDNIGEIKEFKEESNVLHPIICSEEKIEKNILEKSNLPREKSDSDKTEMMMKDNIKKSAILQSEPDGFEILTSPDETSNKIEEKINISCPKSCEQNENITKPDVEDACSNDAIVSTSEDGHADKLVNSDQNITHNETANAPIPDSTINSNGEDSGLKNILPSESGCEMNSDVTSTHVSDVAAKDSQAVSSDVGTSNEVQSLLSILEDNTKIQELLSKIGDSKIKKKLEMLSERLNEIVSEDESTAENNLVENREKAKCDDNTIEHELNESVTQAQEVLAKKGQLDSNDQNNIQELRDINNVESKSKVEDKEDEEKNTEMTNTEENKDTDKKCSEPNKTISEEIAEVIGKTGERDPYCDRSSVNITTEKKEEEENNDKIEPIACNDENNMLSITTEKNKPPVKKGKRRRGKKWCRKPINIEEKRITRSDVVTSLQPMTIQNKNVKKKPSRELTQLQKDIGEMFIKDDVLSATGIRMCRLAKLIDEKKSTEDALCNESSGQEPLVVLDKFSDLNETEKSVDADKIHKKKNFKGKNKDVDGNDLTEKSMSTSKSDTVLEQDLKLKSKEKRRGSLDPYVFETDSVNELNDASDSKHNSSSESESDSVGSTKSSESTEIVETKKKVKRKRSRLWQVGVIKPKNKKKKLDQKIVASTSTDDISETETSIASDRNYCFRKNVSTYNCRICSYSGSDVVHHYKKEHPHTEVLLSRLSPAVAKQAIKESENVNFQEISRISSKKYVCRFCFKEFSKKKLLLEAFFWHVVSMHTGEYKQACSKCGDTQICPMNTDIPPPPKDANGQLLGHICEICNFTQISIENMKSHISGAHGHQEVPVYLINLANLSKSTVNRLLNNSGQTSAETERSRVLRSSRSNQSMAETSDDESDISDGVIKKLKKRTERKDSKPRHIQSKITFESDITDEISNFDSSETAFKIEADTNVQGSHCDEPVSEPEKHEDQIDVLVAEKHDQSIVSQDIFDYPHFKIKQNESGSKEYVCCINGKDNHYKTSLLISMKKHVQLKHSEQWDGYCYLCKVIVTSQGNHKFKECLQHFLDVHMDNFPILQETTSLEKLPEIAENSASDKVPKNVETNKPLINVRPLSELISTPSDPLPLQESGPALPRIESVISLGERVEQPRPSPSYPAPRTESVEVLKHYKYEEFQAEVMSRKHRVVLEGMMSPIKLVHVFKCAGRFCSFSTDNAEDALLHASTHIRVGGVDSLNCAYCDFDASGNAVDLITHVFKSHGSCPFVCGMCFYRAAASQLVKAHIQRVHDKAINVDILKTPFQPSPVQEDDILSREAAVPFYLCCDKNSSDGPCKYKTYTPGKFCEHMESRHSSSTEFFCFICSTSAPTPAELIGHLKTHGLKLYQCTWCVFGADNESQLLEHASALHPTRRPKAYLRIITNKEGSTDFRVLPLAHLHKSDVPVTEVAQTAQRDSPVREAERSIELEKLIGHMIESITTTAETDVSENEENTQNLNLPPSEQPLLDVLSILQNAETLMPRVQTPTTFTEQSSPIISEQSTPVIKALSPATSPNKLPQPEPEIVCLDSDDESPPIEANAPVPTTHNAQDTAPAETEWKKVQLTKLFNCSKCKLILKSGGAFRKHINACFSSFHREIIPCAHCPMWLPKKSIVPHYHTHCDKGGDSNNEAHVQYCQKCLLGFSNLDQVKEHLVNKHNTLPTEGSSLPPFIKSVGPGPKSRRKRMLEHKEKAVEPPEKVTRYGPQDIDKLPINPILDNSVVCSLCGFSTKVRLNMVRHLQQHAQQQPVPQTAPVNPVPHLETNEKHFDKMVNLASSSIGTRYPDKSGKPDGAASAAVPPAMLSRFPKYVPDKHRLTCGAKGCSYISVDETMLKCHWETLHHDVNDFHCVHCPPYQSLDTSVSVTAQRIILHLKMHDEKLYACSLCQYYHYRRQTLEKHMVEVHKNGGQVLIVREGKVAEGSSPTAANASLLKTSAPTMDLKPWQCGLCKFKSLLRPEVVDHCAKVHNSKIQFKCAYCAYRASNPDYITNHQTKSHVGKKVNEIFYYYYREGSIPDEPDGTTRWQKQSQNTGTSEPKVKSEISSDIHTAATQIVLPPENPTIATVDLDVVKKEVEPVQETIDDLCKEFGAFCEPNGLKYKCCLCNNAIEDSSEAMQSHLYEELQYRKWGCSICPYKAFHKGGLNEHMLREHRQNRDPIALPVNTRVETWVAKLLEHQTSLISKYKANLAKQKEEILRTNSGTSTPNPQPQQAKESPAKTLKTTNTPDATELENTFGPFGAASGLDFCCPKCSSSFKDEDIMHSHLESELNRIRWYCSNCQMKFTTYHEAQFHSRSVHAGQGARPIEATRDPAVRAAWIDAVIRAQKQSMDVLPAPTTEKTFHRLEDMSEEPENSLLAVLRYEKPVPTLEEEMARGTPASSVDSDDERLVIDEPLENRQIKTSHKCSICNFASHSAKFTRAHVLRHYGLKPFTCPYCNLNGIRKTIEKHQNMVHPTLPINLVPTQVPDMQPSEYLKKVASTAGPSETAATKLICLVCRNSFTETESLSHSHAGTVCTFGKKGEVVVHCNACRSLHKGLTAYTRHKKTVHPELPVDYLFTKLNTASIESKELLYACDICPQKFSLLRDIKSHSEANHASVLKYTLVPKHGVPARLSDAIEMSKRKSEDDSILPPSKRKSTARKSTTKLPSSTVARKSTTKLPFNVCCETMEYSYYGSKPSHEGLDGVVTMMPFCNKMVPFTFKKLKEIINIDPVVRVEKL